VQLLPGSAHFRVEELPAYAPSGSGEHLYVLVEKEGLSTDEVAERLRAATGRPPVDIGYAGRKDRHAITRQWFSVRLADEATLADLGARLPRGRVAILELARHRNKLRLGHLHGNRFSLGLDAAGEEPTLEKRLGQLAADGVLNRFGAQRFGIGGSAAAARALVAATSPARWRRLIDRRLADRRAAAASRGRRAGRRDRARPAPVERARARAAAAGPRFRRLLASAAQARSSTPCSSGASAGSCTASAPATSAGARAAGCSAVGPRSSTTPARARAGRARRAGHRAAARTQLFAAGAECAADERAWSAAPTWIGSGSSQARRSTARAIGARSSSRSRPRRSCPKLACSGCASRCRPEATRRRCSSRSA
jgi:hypothetical protein